MSEKENLNIDEIERIELRSNEVQEILSRPPKWIIRWGISVIFIIIAIVITGSNFFKYPDIVTAKIVLTTENPPAKVLSKISGKIQNLFVTNKQYVKKNDIVGVIENPANFQDIKAVFENLDYFKKEYKTSDISKLLDKNYNLGSVQTLYSSLAKHIKEYNRFLRLDYHNKKITQHKKELQKYSLYLQNLKTQEELMNEECKLTHNQFCRDSSLHSQELLSDADFERSKSQLISKKYSCEQVKTSINNIELQIENLNQNILDLKLQYEKQLSDKTLFINENIENLRSTIDAWMYKYVLIAPTSGKITFNQYWNENQTVSSGATVMTVIPENEGEIIGKVQLDFRGAGKVREGQLANIQFSNYPKNEFGMVQGEIFSISMAPENDFYTVEIKLKNGLKTFYGIDLDFKQEMQGTAEIITDDLSLLHRILGPLRFIIKRNTKFGDLN